MSKHTDANTAAAKQHLSAAIRELIRATDQSQPTDPRLDMIDTIRVIWAKL
jgi:hypothetical protein